MAICFRDTTYCASPHCVNACGRKLTKQVLEDAKKWWKDCEGEPPIAVAYFCGEPEFEKQNK